MLPSETVNNSTESSPNTASARPRNSHASKQFVRIAKWLLKSYFAQLPIITCCHLYGPFALQLADLHASNNFVDQDWNITYLIDLEWINSRPIEMLSPPYWIGGYDLSKIWENMGEVSNFYDEFMEIFELEETKLRDTYNVSFSNIMRDTTVSGRKWFWHGLASINAMQLITKRYINGQFLPERLLKSQARLISSFWDRDTAGMVKSKINDYEQYERELRGLFKREEDSSLSHL